MTEDPSNPVSLDYAAPERPRRQRLVVIIFGVSLVHLVAAALTLAVWNGVWNGGGALKWLPYVLFFPLYVALRDVTIPFAPWLIVFVLIPLNSVVYGTVLAAVVLAASTCGYRTATDWTR